MLFLALLCLAAVVSAASIRVRADTCDVHGYDISAAYNYDGSGIYSTRSACGARCSADVNCKSFGFGGAECLLYDKTIAENVNINTASPYSFSDIGCLTTPTSSAAPSPTPSQLCDGIGYDLGTSAYNYDGSGAAASLAACSSRCLSQSFCLGFAFSSTDCLLYSVAASSNFYPQASSPYHFYDRTCFPNPTTTTTTTSSTPTPTDIFCLQVTGSGPPGKGYYAYFHDEFSDTAIYFTSSNATTAPPALFYIYAPFGAAFIWDTRGRRIEFGLRLSNPSPPQEQPLIMVGQISRGDQSDYQFVYPTIDTSNQLKGSAGATGVSWSKWSVDDASFATEQRLYLQSTSGVKSQIGLTVVAQSLCPGVAVADP